MNQGQVFQLPNEQSTPAAFSRMSLSDTQRMKPFFFSLQIPQPNLGWRWTSFGVLCQY